MNIAARILRTRIHGQQPQVCYACGADQSVHSWKVCCLPGEQYRITGLPCEQYGITELPCEQYRITESLGGQYRITESPCEQYRITESPGEQYRITELPGEQYRITELSCEQYRITELPCEHYRITELPWCQSHPKQSGQRKSLLAICCFQWDYHWKLPISDDNLTGNNTDLAIFAEFVFTSHLAKCESWKQWILESHSPLSLSSLYGNRFLMCNQPIGLRPHAPWFTTVSAPVECWSKRVDSIVLHATANCYGNTYYHIGRCRYQLGMFVRDTGVTLYSEILLWVTSSCCNFLSYPDISTTFCIHKAV